MDVIAPPKDTRLTIHAHRLRNLQHRHDYTTTSSRSSTKRLALTELDPNTAGNKRKKTCKSTGVGRGRPKNTAAAARAIMVNATGEAVLLGPLSSRPIQGLPHNAPINNHTVIQCDYNPATSHPQVVISQRDPLPASTIWQDITESAPTEFMDIDSIAPPPGPEYSERTLCHHDNASNTCPYCAAQS